MPQACVSARTMTERLRIKLVSNTNQEVLFEVSGKTKLGTVMHAYCNRLKIPINSVRFLFDGNRINEGLLVSQAGLEQDDIIDVQEAMEGGGDFQRRTSRKSTRLNSSHGR